MFHFLEFGKSFKNSMEEFFAVMHVSNFLQVFHAAMVQALYSVNRGGGATPKRQGGTKSMNAEMKACQLAGYNLGAKIY